MSGGTRRNSVDTQSNTTNLDESQALNWTAVRFLPSDGNRRMGLGEITAMTALPLRLLSLFAAVAISGCSASASTRPMVVELFQSQGCSSCPPANANLATVADKPGVIALNFSVTYWDDEHWQDT